MSETGMNNRLKILVTAGLGVSYVIMVSNNIRNKQTAAAIGNSILLPTSLIWLWFVTDGSS